ncbi:uncharacterized protein LOC121401385 [Xenopus laevis]|uniref:Uncharacterized protein LOC121401385 n=1 Tax=Xenopus laevis TaxID=8355 RepID=A0A8J1MJJ1_XENLA|nr:uncharacterized protein LOC121401385 [Xenopus laevis]
MLEAKGKMRAILKGLSVVDYEDLDHKDHDPLQFFVKFLEKKGCYVRGKPEESPSYAMNKSIHPSDVETEMEKQGSDTGLHLPVDTEVEMYVERVVATHGKKMKTQLQMMVEIEVKTQLENLMKKDLEKQPQVDMQLETQVDMQLEPQVDMQLETQLDMQLETQVDMQLETQEGMQGETQEGMQGETQEGMQVETQVGMQVEKQIQTQLETKGPELELDLPNESDTETSPGPTDEHDENDEEMEEQVCLH